MVLAELASRKLNVGDITDRELGAIADLRGAFAQSAGFEEERRAAAREHLLPFMLYTKPNYRQALHHLKMASAFELVERGEIQRLMLFAPPRHGKSEIASRRFPDGFSVDIRKGSSSERATILSFNWI